MNPLRPLLPLLATAWAAVSLPTAAAAQAPPSDDVTSYAIVVGSNAGGPGQDTLRFAEDDARRVATVLRELGGYTRDHVHMVLAPSPARLLDAIDQVAAEVERDSAAGRRSLVFFYYSGHARATALVLGDDELSLSQLRGRLTELPSSVTLVVLDACQSGAFTRVKGAEPAADFSFNSRTGLDATGLAVMASSSESELSQESDFLQGSYFTHHLLVGLRGGGDRDKDGRVSLDEAYQYAYNQTLLATSATAVGSQHVSLEVDLKGQGEVTLTFPDQADATMVLPAALAGDVLIERLPAEAVLAEVHKVAGDDLDVAVPAGTYRVLVRSAAVMQRCPVTVPHGGAIAVDLAGCDEIALADTVAKGGDAATPIRNRWAIELGAGLAGARRDAFTRRLEDAFDYSGGALRSQLSVELVRRMTPNLALTGRVTRIASEHYSYATDLEPLGYDVTSNVFTVGGRGELSFHDDHTLLFAEAGLGLTWARDRFEDEMDRVFSDDFFAPHLAGAVGVVRYSPWLNGVGMGLEARWLYAPTVTNELDDPDTMDVGGLFFGLTVDYRP